MNKRAILKSLAAAAALYSVAGFFGVPYLLKNSVPEKVNEATKGGRLSIESASFNPFTFHMKLKNVSFKTPQNSDLFALKAFSINVDPLDYLWRGGLVVRDLSLREPTVTVRRDEKGDFNFKWLTELGGDSEEDKSLEPPKLIIRHLAIKNGTINYSDYSEGKAYTLDIGPVGFNLDHVDLRNLSNKNGKMRLYATINEGGFIDFSGKLDALSPLNIRGNVAFNSGKLYTPWRYFKDKFPIEVADGTAAFGFDYRFNSNDLNATELSNLYFGIDKLRIIPKGENRNLFTLSALRLKKGDVFPMKKVFNAETLSVNGVDVSVYRSQEGKIDWLTYIDEIQKAFPSDENKTSEPWNFSLGSTAVENIGIAWRDDAPREPYSVNVKNISLHSGVISSDSRSLLNFNLTSGALSVIRKRDQSLSAGLDGIAVDGITIDRARKFAQVQKISVLQPSIAFKRLSDGSIDLSYHAYAAPSRSSSSSETPWGYRIDELNVSNGSVGFVDEVPHKKVTANLDRLNMSVRGFESDPGVKSSLSFSSRLNEKSTIDLKSDIVRSSQRAKGTVELKGMDVSLADPYIEPSTYASLRRGSLSLLGTYDYRPSRTSINGKISLSDWVVNDTRDNSVLLGWDKIGATPFVYAYPDNRLKINQLSIDGFYTNALIDSKKVLNYSTLSKNPKGDANTTKKSGGNPFGLEIVKLLLHNSSANFSDLSLPLPFKSYIHDMEGSVLGISTTKNVTTFVNLRGGVDQYGLAKINGQLNTKDPKQFTDMKVAFDNLELKNYTPYSLQFLGYKIEGGKLFLNLGYKIDGGKLDASNQVVIKKIELGAEKEGGSPWPMRFIVALLEDSDGIIDIDLPIEGDVNNPDFKYGKVVWQVIGNLFTKAVTSPFRLLGSLMGIESDKLSSIDFDAGSATLLPPEIEKLDHITTMLSKRPKLALNIYGGYDEVGDVRALKGRKLVQEALKRNKNLKIDSPQAISVELLEDMAEDALERQDRKELKNKLLKQYPEEAAFVRYYSAALIDKLIPLQPLAPQELQALAQQRAETIRKYLMKTPDFEKRVTIRANESAKALKEGEIPVRLEIVIP
ncbi:hypothetical protein Sulku_2534 [Sulfuricurvum kujiense DSM 16994]|uniref:DUF748 domain-containing protein n=1 Tax=Sulfuricurvum kujiense (strain ATCC BAA-921 / DSM 16994 / JCM 11577 / YK-1) TaxID=709032 RepID=E4TZG6_SULKY|nr:DUF748 domain-containing protein [Sulfuricurvum kujiense]ADR35193.1 hypothetical protein Sulku_2534 [Sulfuricurvum kujiense DSM 16994]